MPENGLLDAVPAFKFDPPELPILQTRNYDMADYSYEIIMEEIQRFEASLDNEHEVAAKLASFGQNVTMAISEVSYANPSTLIFSGLVGGQQATLIQHMSQLNFLLLAVERRNPHEPKKKIGFTANWDEE